MDFDAEIQMFQKNFDVWNLTTELVNYDSLSLSVVISLTSEIGFVRTHV